MDPAKDNSYPIWLKTIFYVAPMFGFSGLMYLFRYFMKGTSYKKDTKITDKVVIVTGANSGIGKETAIDLAKRGGKVYIACRDTQRGEEALKDIKKESGSSKVFFLQLDLASLDSVREFSKKFHELEHNLHILVNNAGIMACPQSKTTDGFELQFGTNHVGHFLLTNLLMDLLKASSPSRVIVVSDLVAKWGSINKEDLMIENSYGKFKAYTQSKLANNLFTHEFSKKIEGTGVTANYLIPGIVVTGLFRNIIASPWIRTYLDPILKQFFNTPTEGAQTAIFLAVDPEVEKISGKCFANCEQATSSAESTNDELSAWLWKKSEELVGLNYV